MSTRGFVGVMIGDVCRAVYVHFDCYLEGVGNDLRKYTTQKAVEELISHGDRSSLESGYYKDRGDSGVDPVDYDSFDDFYEAAKDAWAEYYYLFYKGVWYCGDTYGTTPISQQLIPFAEAVVLMKRHNAQ